MSRSAVGNPTSRCTPLFTVTGTSTTSSASVTSTRSRRSAAGHVRSCMHRQPCPRGSTVVGANRVRQALDDTAVFLESLHEQTIEMMNAGASLDEILHTVRPPAKLADRPYLQPVYDEPEFVVRNIWRLYGGWWDGDPSSLKPAPVARLASELVTLAGPDAVSARVEDLLAGGDDVSLRLAGHLVELLVHADPASTPAHSLR